MIGLPKTEQSYTVAEIQANVAKSLEWVRSAKLKLEAIEGLPVPMDGVRRAGHHLKVATADNEYRQARLAYDSWREVQSWYCGGITAPADTEN